jgi:glycosyltransferase involved in cell wall biosynthesis
MILMYHKVDLTSPTMWWVNVQSFHAQMCWLAGRKVVYLDDYDPANPDHVVITFDGVYSNVLQYAAPILRHFGYPFELFLTSDWIGLQNRFDLVEPPCSFANESELLQLVALGGRLQWHTKSHARLDATRGEAGWREVEAELTVPGPVKAMDPKGFNWFAYPHGEFSDDIVSEVKKRFRGAVSCNQGNDDDPYKLNRITALNSPNPTSKKVSVIIPSHNYGRFLTEAVESVLAQTLQPDSILIVDDGSEDDTKEIGSKYQSLYPELIRFHRSEENLGIVETFNRSVASTHSDYICVLGADNRLASNYLEEAIVSLLSTKSDIAYTDFRLFGELASEEYLRHEPERQGRIIDDQFFEIVFPKFTLAAPLKASFIHGSSVYSRAAFDAVGGYSDRKSGRPEDANLFRRMTMAGFKAVKAEKTWLEYRQHSHSQANAISRLEGEVEFLRIYSKRLEFKTKLLERSLAPLAPLVKFLSAAENELFRQTMKLARVWRRLTR